MNPSNGPGGPVTGSGSWVLRTYGSRTAQALLDVVEFAGMAQRLVSRGRDVYDRDEAIRLAGEAVVHRVGEAVARLPGTFIDEYPELRLKAFQGLRNLVAQRYHHIDDDMLWEAIAVDIPRLADQVKDILDRF